MAMVEPSSIPWFIAFMRLHCRGLIPTVTPSEFMPGHKELAEFWGPRSPLGFTFSDHGLPGYEIYVRQLFSRVLQLPWPSTGVLPFNFARGLLVEALGVEVNWAEFGYRATHPHQSHSGIPRVLPEYRGLVRPLRALALVMPRAHIPSPLAERIARHLNEHGGGTTIFEDTLLIEGPSSPVAPVTPTIHVASKHPAPAQSTRIVNGGEGCSRECTARALQLPSAPGMDSPSDVPPVQEPAPDVEPAVKTEFPADNVPAAAHLQNGQSQSEGNNGGPVTFDQSAVSALLLLRPSFKASVDNERTRLHMASLGIGKPVTHLRKCFHEHRGRLRLLERKVSEKSRSHDKAVSELRRARDQLKAAKVNLNAQGKKDDMATANSSLKMYEELVDIWTENVSLAYTKLETSELKLKMQKEGLAKTQDDLTAAQVLFKEKTRKIEKSLAHLHALSTALGRL
ncbi:hypothetical protein M758_9G084200 [Ceratodon purpureus]|nr:hypothetical protein M758_9G084200 [Ceratodon purpureus]